MNQRLQPKHVISRYQWCPRPVPIQILVIIAFVAVACVRTPPGPAFESLEPISNDRARMVLYRADQQGSLASVRVTIDGRELGRFSNHEFETTSLTPGTHVLRAGLRGFGLLAWGWNSHRFRVGPGETEYLAISVRLAARESPATRDLDIAGRTGGAASENVYIVPKSAQEALSELEATTRLRRPEPTRNRMETCGRWATRVLVGGIHCEFPIVCYSAC